MRLSWNLGERCALASEKTCVRESFCLISQYALASGSALRLYRKSCVDVLSEWESSRLECHQHPRKSLNAIQLRHQLLAASV